MNQIVNQNQVGANGHVGRTVPVYRLLAEDIRRLGVKIVFGLVSDDTAALAASLDAMGVRFCGARHENNAIAMAEGFAYASGTLGVAVIGRGPATANGLNAAVSVSRTGSPVLIIYGEAATSAGTTNAVGPDYKALNAIGVLSAAGLRTFVAAGAGTARGVFADAAAAARSGATVTLHLPINVQAAEIDVVDETPPPVPPFTPRAPVGARAAAIEAAVALLKERKRPLIVAGLGAHRAGAKLSLERLAERIGALLITSARGKDMFLGNPYNLGLAGSFSHSMARRMIDEIDCVLVFGAGLNFLTTSFGNFVPAVPLIHIDTVRTNIGKWCFADIAVVGDARIVAEQLLEALPVRPTAEMPPFHTEGNRRTLAGFDLSRDFRPVDTPRTMDPRSVAVALDKLLPKERNLVYDAGNFLGIVPYLSVPGPGNFKFTSDFASIGLGFGTALGVAAAKPDTTTVLVIGDGGFLMTMGELESTIREDLPLVIVLMNDCAYGSELHFLKERGLPVATSVFPDVDFAPIAEAFGFQAATIRTADELSRLAPMLAQGSGPVLLDCKINAAVAAPFISEIAHFDARR